MKDLYGNLKTVYEKVYAEKGFGQYICPCFEKCKRNGFDYDSSFICNKSAKIGKYYSQQRIKIVFIGKEDVSAIKDLEKPAEFTDTKNQHYRGLKLILAALLDEYDVDKLTNEYVYVKGEESLHERFALTNQYHCAFKTKEQDGKRHGIKTSETMWENCAKIVKLELEVLHPDVVVIQAGWSAKQKTKSQNRINGIRHYFSDDWTITEVDEGEIFALYKATNGSGQICYIIGSYHPSFHQWRDDTYLLPLKKRIKMVKMLLGNKRI